MGECGQRRRRVACPCLWVDPFWVDDCLRQALEMVESVDHPAPEDAVGLVDRNPVWRRRNPKLFCEPFAVVDGVAAKARGVGLVYLGAPGPVNTIF